MMKKTYISVLSIFIYVTKKEQTCKNIDWNLLYLILYVKYLIILKKRNINKNFYDFIH